MVFSSFIFIVGFLPLCLGGFWLISKVNHHASKLFLCLASLVFYAWWDVKWLPVLLLSIIFNYLISQQIIKVANDQGKTGTLLVTAIVVNLGGLFFYKYLGPALIPFGYTGTYFQELGLPLGISFFTFTQIAFLIDASQGFKERYTFTNYLLFVTFFPHLIAGPIVHHRDLMPQFEQEKNYRFQPTEFAIGLSIFSIGLAKKTLIADQLSAVSLRLLEGGGAHSPATAWFGILCYSMQLYFDFSGYSDMAIGLSRMFGIKFPINFNSPYKATNIIDFWQRWHITLTRFLTAYLYNPIALTLVRRRAVAGKSTSKRVSRTVVGFLQLIALPTMVTMLLAGIWHGAGLQFAIFGILHGVYISVNHAWRTFGPSDQVIDRFPKYARSLVFGAIVYLCVLLAQIFFRASSASAALALLGDLVAIPHLNRTAFHGIELFDIFLLASSMVIVWFAPNTQEIMADYDPALDLGNKFTNQKVRARFNVGWAVAFSFVLFLGLTSIRAGQPFIYFQF